MPDFDLNSIGWGCVEGALARLRAGGDEFEQLVVHQLAELDKLRTTSQQHEDWLQNERSLVRREQRDMDRQRENLEHLRQTSETSMQQAVDNARQLAQAQAEFERSKNELRIEQHEWETRRSEFAESLARERQAWERVKSIQQTELDEAIARLQRLRDESIADASAGEMSARRQMADLDSRRAALEQELAEARAQIARLAGAAQELALVREQLVQAQSELEAIRAERDRLGRLQAATEMELAQLRERATPDGGAAGEIAAIKGQLAQAEAALAEAHRELHLLQEQALRERAEAAEWRERLTNLEMERALLETELESVRQRAYELAESTTADKQRMADERAEWQSELRQLRRILERQSHSPPSEPPLRAAFVEHANARAPVGAGVETDPLLQSVMAQFDMLQKDISRRRTANGR